MQKMKVAILLLLLINCIPGYGQYNSVDSLVKLLQSQASDTDKVHTLNLISQAYWQDNVYEKSLNNAKIALALSKQINFKKGMAEATMHVGMAMGLKLEPGELQQYFNAIELYEQVGDKDGVYECYNSIRFMYTIKIRRAVRMIRL